MSGDTVHLDFESRSIAPFGKQKGAVTAYQYANHWGTAIWLLRYAIGSGPIKGWHPWAGDPLPDELVEAVRAGTLVVGHNVGFEWCLWNFILVPQFGAPPLPIEQTDDTAARAAIMALPRSLEDACKAMKLPVEKDMEGNRLMQRMAKPRKVHPVEDESQAGMNLLNEAAADPMRYTISPDGKTVYEWWCDEDRLNRLGAYCDTDVEAERALDQVLAPMTGLNRRDFLLVHKANMCGVQVDVELARKAQRAMAVVDQRYCDELASITGFQVNAPTEVTQMKAWLSEVGIDTDSLDKANVNRLLEEYPDPESSINRLLAIRQEAGKSSVAKLARFIELTHHDGRMRENFMFHGAAPGRLAGKGAQLQNLPSRTGLSWRQAEQVIELIHSYDPETAVEMIEMFYGHTPEAVSSCLRAHLQSAPERQLYVADFSNIEGRVAAWFGGEQWKLDAFRAYDTIVGYDGNEPIRLGPDLYTVAAGGILGVDPSEVSKKMRNALGKPSELALGFGGGVGAFQTMAKLYGIVMADYWGVIQEALDDRVIQKTYEHWDLFGARSGMLADEWLPSEAVKIAWREKHPGIVKCWGDCERAATEALKRPGKWFPLADGKLAFGAKEIGGVMFLICRLPSGRRIYKAHAKLKMVEKFGRQKATVSYWGVDSVTRRWVPMTTYGGDLFQSAVQGSAYDLMMHGWANVEEDNFDVVLSVHDELGAEGDPGRDVHHFERLMADLPAWAEGCPVVAAGYVADRYRKD